MPLRVKGVNSPRVRSASISLQANGTKQKPRSLPPIPVSDGSVPSAYWFSYDQKIGNPTIRSNRIRQRIRFAFEEVPDSKAAPRNFPFAALSGDGENETVFCAQKAGNPHGRSWKRSACRSWKRGSFGTDTGLPESDNGRTKDKYTCTLPYQSVFRIFRKVLSWGFPFFFTNYELPHSLYMDSVKKQRENDPGLW